LDAENREKMTKITQNEDDRNMNIPGPWSPDGRGFYFLSNSNNEYKYLAFYNIINSKIERVIDSIWDIESVTISGDGNNLVYTINENGYSKIYCKNLVTNEEREIDLQNSGVIEGLKVSPDNKKIGFLFETPTSPFDIYTVDLNTWPFNYSILESD
jgi:Tol biopolymer transport system component